MKLPLATLMLAVLAVGPMQAAPGSERLLTEDYLNLLKIDLRAAKAAVVADALELNAEEARRFWPLYRRYDEALGKLNHNRISLLREISHSYGRIDDDRAREFSRRNFDFLKSRLALLEKYTRKIEKATSPSVAARFAEIEQQLLTLVDVQIASEMPLIPRKVVVSQIGM